MSNTYRLDRPNWRRRLVTFLLRPTRHPASELTTGFADVIYTDVDIRFGWRDRMRLLVTGHAEVRVVTQCENKPGNVLTRSSVSTA